MDIKELDSQINLINARITQVENSTLYNDDEKAILIDRYIRELAGLQDKKDELELQQLENQLKEGGQA